LYPQLVLQVEDGDLDGALVSLRAIVYLQRPLAEGPTLMDALVTVACRVFIAQCVERVLAQGEPSDPALTELRRLLEPEILRPFLRVAFRGERAMVDDTIRAMDDGRLSRDDVAKSRMFASPALQSGWPEVDRWLSSLTGTDFSRANAVARLRHFTWLIERL